jgi:hypothetical protein
VHGSVGSHPGSFDRRLVDGNVGLLDPFEPRDDRDVEEVADLELHQHLLEPALEVGYQPEPVAARRDAIERRQNVVEELVGRHVREGCVELAGKRLVFDPELAEEPTVEMRPESARALGRERRLLHAGLVAEIDEVRSETLLHGAHALELQPDAVALADLDEELREGRVRMQDRVAGIEEDDVDHRTASSVSCFQTRSASATRSSSEPLLSTTMSARFFASSGAFCALIRLWI